MPAHRLAFHAVAQPASNASPARTTSTWTRALASMAARMESMEMIRGPARSAMSRAWRAAVAPPPTVRPAPVQRPLIAWSAHARTFAPSVSSSRPMARRAAPAARHARHAQTLPPAPRATRARAIPSSTTQHASTPVLMVPMRTRACAARRATRVAALAQVGWPATALHALAAPSRTAAPAAPHVLLAFMGMRPRHRASPATARAPTAVAAQRQNVLRVLSSLPLCSMEPASPPALRRIMPPLAAVAACATRAAPLAAAAQPPIASPAQRTRLILSMAHALA